jgi:SAM-dependent methyltransferase
LTHEEKPTNYGDLLGAGKPPGDGGMTQDPRDPLYKDLHAVQLEQQEGQNRTSAHTILGILFEYYRPRSVLDVGCGLGTWLAVARELGVAEVRGVEGLWLEPARLRIDPDLVTRCDLEQGFSLGRGFDLVVCLEVAEHLAAPAADPLVASLAAHGDLVLFSAAIPHQGGHGHVNEQFPGYWASRFARHEFRPVDLLRPRIWNDPSALWYLRQNTLLFAHERALAAHEPLRREAAVERPLSLVHPDVYLSRLSHVHRALQAHKAIMELLAQGGIFEVARTPDGRTTVSRKGPPA